MLLLRARDHRRRRGHLKSFLNNTLLLGHFVEHLPCCCLRTRRHLCSNEPYSSDFVVPERQVAEPSRWKKVNAERWGVSSDMIPPSPWRILKTLRVRGFESYLVGGCVRDLLLNREPKDFDIITTANLGQVKKEFRRAIIIGQRFPICRVPIKGTAIEVSSFETVSRHAEEKERVIFSKMSNSCDKKDFILWRDSMHRDFTINSLFYDPFNNVIYDYSNGIADLKALKLRTLIPAKLSFQEDCARILRGLRIAGRLGLTISMEAATAMREYSPSVSNLGKFRVMMEMNYMLSYGAASSTISLLQRFHLLDKILPFHAAYLDEQAKERSSTSCMMMKLFSNLDQLFSCGRPCPPTLWVGLLAFHQALVANPQDGLAIWTFASVLYHGSWKKGVRFARENAKVQVASEISGFCEGQSDEELIKEVTQMACLVQDSVYALMDAEPLSKYLSMFAVSPSSSTVFIPRTIGRKATELFDVLLNDAEVHKKKKLTFDLDYHLLVRGDVHETAFALGKVILKTLGGESFEEMEVSRIEQEVVEEEVPRKKKAMIEEKVPQVPKEERDIETVESEFVIKRQGFEELLKERPEIEANGSRKLSDFVNGLVIVKDDYTAMSQYGKSEVKLKDEPEIRKVINVVMEDIKTVEENMSEHCGMVIEDRKQTLVTMEDSGNLLQQEKNEDHTLQHEFSSEKTDQSKAAVAVDKVIRKRNLVSDQGANLKKLKGKKLSKLENCEQETEVTEVVAVSKNASLKLAQNKMQQEEHLEQPSIGDKVHSTNKVDGHDSARKSTKKIEKVKRKGKEILSMDGRPEQEELVVALGSLSEKGKRSKLHDGETVKGSTSLGKESNKDDRVKKGKKKSNKDDRVKKEKEKSNKDDRVKKEKEKSNKDDRVKKEKEKSNKDDRVKKEKEKSNKDDRVKKEKEKSNKDDRVKKEKKKVVRSKTEKPEGRNHYSLSFVEEDGEKRDAYSPEREDVRSKIKHTKEEIDQHLSCNKKEEKDCDESSLHEMFREKRVGLQTALKARIPLSKLFRR